jgi:transketolase
MENRLKNKILDISKRNKLSHIGSCLSALPILIEIYNKKRPDDKVTLSNAHAHLAHLVVMEEFKLIAGAELLLNKYGIHCDINAGCDASGGSLGHGVGIAVGMAIALPKSKIYCMISDGSICEGSEWEALRIANSLKLENLEIHANFNGYTAVAESDITDVTKRMTAFVPNIAHNVYIHETNNGEGFGGLDGHYKTI